MVPKPGWREISTDKINKMKKSGLWDSFSQINICIHYQEKAFDILKEEMHNDGRVHFLYHTDSVPPLGEQYTNRTIKNNIDRDTEPSYVFRFHLKGLNHWNTTNWAANDHYNQLIDLHTIEKWRDAVKKLEQGYDAAGIYWVKQPWPHFKGNVWWATSDYIKRLRLLKMPHENNFQQQITGGGWLVHDAESWVGTANPRAYDMYRETDQIGDHPDL